MVKKTKVTKEIFIEKTLEMIDKEEGLRGVNLRKIAREIGCAHTNAYNYFSSFEDLIGQSLLAASAKMKEYVVSRVKEAKDEKSFFDLVVSSQLEFANNHTGLYKLIWLEKIDVDFDLEDENHIKKQGNVLSLLLLRDRNLNISNERKFVIADIIHGYIHGEICKLINKRHFFKTDQEFIDKVVYQTRQVFKVLVENP